MDSAKIGSHYQTLGEGQKNIISLYYGWIFFLGMILLGWEGTSYDFPLLTDVSEEEVNITNIPIVPIWIFLYRQLSKKILPTTHSLIEEIGMVDYDYETDMVNSSSDQLSDLVEVIDTEKYTIMSWGRKMVDTAFFARKSFSGEKVDLVKINNDLTKDYSLLSELALQSTPNYLTEKNKQAVAKIIKSYFNGRPLFFSPYLVPLTSLTYDSGFIFDDDELPEDTLYSNLLFQEDGDEAENYLTQENDDTREDESIYDR